MVRIVSRQEDGGGEEGVQDTGITPMLAQAPSILPCTVSTAAFSLSLPHSPNERDKQIYNNNW